MVKSPDYSISHGIHDFHVAQFSRCCLFVLILLLVGGEQSSYSQTRLWNPEGRPICTATGWQRNVRVATDGADGAIVAWEDLRTGSQPAIYAARL